MSTQYDREENYIHEAYERGEMSLKEYNSELRELQRSYQGYLEEQAQDAYDDVMSNGY